MSLSSLRRSRMTQRSIEKVLQGRCAAIRGSKRTIQCLPTYLLYYSVSVYPRQRTWQFYQTRLMKVVPIFTERPPIVIASQKDEYLLIFSDFNSTPLSSLPLNAMIHPIPFAGPYPVLQHKIKNHRKGKTRTQRSSGPDADWYRPSKSSE